MVLEFLRVETHLKLIAVKPDELIKNWVKLAAQYGSRITGLNRFVEKTHFLLSFFQLKMNK